MKARPARRAFTVFGGCVAVRFGETHLHTHRSPDDRRVWERVDVPAVGGPVDGRSLLVPLDDDGVPPPAIDETWLWVEYGGELLDADMDGVYELESVAGVGPPWVYVWAPGPQPNPP